MTRIARSRSESADGLPAAARLIARDVPPTGVLMTFDHRRTPKARIVSAWAAPAAIAILGPVFGPPLALPDGVGWNLNRADFDRAQGLLIARRRDPGAPSPPNRASLLTLEPAAPPPALWLDGRKLRLVGQGKVFRLSRRQAATRATPGEFNAGARVRLAYYG